MMRAKLCAGLSALSIVLTALLLPAAEVAKAAPPDAASAERGQGSGKGGGGTQPGWREDFNDSLEAIRNRGWRIEDSASADRKFGVPGYIPHIHRGVYEAGNVSLVQGADGNQYLRLRLTQETGLVDGTLGVISLGALVYTQQTLGYGTYEWRMRMSSTAATPEGPGSAQSGNVSAGFLYANNSETEIDFEFAGHVMEDADPTNNETLYMANWNNRDPARDPLGSESTVSVATALGINSEFKTYKFDWQKNGITFYVDGVAQVIHRTDVPSKPAPVIMNHWGTHRPGGFGGGASIGVERTLYVDWVRYTPAR